jgi:hypothetical protein
MPMLTERREELIRDINDLKERLRLAWMDIVSKPMTGTERLELCKSVESLAKDLDNLQTKLIQLPKA